MNTRFTLSAAVFLLLQNDKGEILLARRYNTGHADGQYSLPAGHIDGDEPLVEAMCREASEELGLTFTARDLALVYVQHVRQVAVPTSSKEYLNFLFLSTVGDQLPKIMEPDKCDDLLWCNPDQLPENTVHYVRDMVTGWRENRTFAELGW